MRTWRQDGGKRNVKRQDLDNVAVIYDEEDRYGGSCDYVKELRFTFPKEGKYATFARYPYLIPLLSFLDNGMNHCSGIDHAIHDAALELVPHHVFWQRVDSLIQEMYNGHDADDCVLHARDHVKFPMFHVNIVTGEATAVRGYPHEECGHIRIADENVSTQPHQRDGPQHLAYKLENRKLYVWMSEETENMPYP